MRMHAMLRMREQIVHVRLLLLGSAPISLSTSLARLTARPRVRAEHQLAAPERKLSVKRSLRCKMEAAAAAAAGEAAGGGAAAKASAGGGGGISNTASAAAPAADAAAPAAPFLSLGLSPLHAMDDGAFKHSPLVRRFCDIAYARGTAFYPFASLAAGKAKYGGGMAGGRYADPAVSYRQVRAAGAAGCS